GSAATGVLVEWADSAARAPAGTAPGPAPQAARLAGVLALILVALSLGLSNFAAAIGIGISGAIARPRLKVCIIFHPSESVMPVAGLALGHGLAAALGGAARWLSAGLLIATGAWAIAQVVRADDQAPAPEGGHGTGRLIVTGLALSIDNV